MEIQHNSSCHVPPKNHLTHFIKRGCVSAWCIQLASLVSEIILGSLIGGLAGWAIGWRLGVVYSTLCKPTYLLSSHDINAWYCMPATFSAYGLWIGAVVGILAAHLYAQHLLKERIALLYEEEQTDLRQLARLLDQREQKIEAIVRQLIQKGRISAAVNTQNEPITNYSVPKEFAMKPIYAICVSLFCLFFLFGCLPPSLHPLYTEETLIFDEQLLGKWYGDGGTWSFVKEGEDAYRLNVIDGEGKQGTLEVHLVQLGEHRFIDLYPGENTDLENTSEIYRLNLVPAHTFMKIERTDDNLRLQWVCFGPLIEEDPNLLKHEKFKNKNNIVITAQSEDIQRVLLQNLEKVVGDGKEIKKEVNVFINDGTGIPFKKEIKLQRCPSVFSQKDIMFDPKLIGQWESQKGQYIDIMQEDNLSYDIMILDETNTCREFKAVFFMLKNTRLLGLFYTAPSQAEQDAGLHLIPDTFLFVEQMEPELILREIDWEAMHEFLRGEQELDSGELSNADFVLQKVSGNF